MRSLQSDSAGCRRSRSFRLQLMMMTCLVLVHGFTHRHYHFPRSCSRTDIDHREDAMLSLPTSTLHNRRARVLPLAATRTSTTRRRPPRTFEEYLPRLQEYREQHGHSNVTAAEDEDLYEWTYSIRKQYRTRMHKLNPNVRNALHDLDFSWWMSPSPKTKRKMRWWHEYFPKLEQYNRQHGHCNVTKEEDHDLYQWIFSLRMNYRPFVRAAPSERSKFKKSKRLSEEQLLALDTLGFSWYVRGPIDEDANQKQNKSNEKISKRPRGRPRKRQPSSKQRTWEEYFPLLCEFHRVHGHCDVTAKQDHDLYKWTASLRKNHQCQAIVRNLSSSLSTSVPLLSKEQFDALEDLGFSWSPPIDKSTAKLRARKNDRKTWEEYFPRLVRFFEAHGHCNITMVADNSKDNMDLAQWVESLKHRNFSDEKIHLLQQLGIPLESPTGNPRRREMIDKLHEFYKENGHLFVKEGDDAELFNWTKMCVQDYGHKYLLRLVEPDYGAKPPNRARWETMLQRLADYRRVHGHCRVSSTEGDPKLYRFVQNQRHQYRRLVRGEPSQLNSERVEALEDLDFDWGKSHDIRWRERVKELDAFQKIYGHSRVPQKFDQNPQLGRWVMNQRTLKRMNEEGLQTSLRSSRINRLEQTGFVWRAHDDAWWKMFQWLKEFQEENGHLTIDTNDVDREVLRQWLNEQRHEYRSDEYRHRLTKERVEALESLPGFQWVCRDRSGPSKADWSELMSAMRKKGITPQAKVKTHWFDGVNPLAQDVKTVWTDEELVALWNEGVDEDEDDDDYYYEDEDSRNFLRA